MDDITRKLLWTIAVGVLGAVLILSVGNAIRVHIVEGQMDDMREGLAAQGQTNAELWQAVDGLKDKVEILEGYEVLLIMGSGHEITICTEDGQILKCYFPDEPIEKEGN